MKRSIFSVVLVILLLIPFFQLHSQNLSTTETTVVTFDTTGLPQWVKDLRRWEIIAFGTFPFTLFAVTFVTDMIRWGAANGMDFSEEGRRYAPWPFKSAGAVDMTGAEFTRTVLISAGLSIALAFVDLIIVSVKRSNQRKLLESAPSGSIVIERTQSGDDPPPDETPSLSDNQ